MASPLAPRRQHLLHHGDHHAPRLLLPCVRPFLPAPSCPPLRPDTRWNTATPAAAASSSGGFTQQEQARYPGPQGGRGSPVRITVENSSWNSRKVFASVDIAAPADLVWQCLTDYEGLSSFIPSLVENRCLEKKQNGAVVLQVGAQDLAMGVRFSASCTLDCTEYPSGVPPALCSNSGDGSDGALPYPRSSQPGVSSKDIAFHLIKGDFKEFRGIWRMQPHAAGSSRPDCSMLSYAVYVQPQSWLPVQLVQSRIEKEVVRNLGAVRDHAERRHERSMSSFSMGSTGSFSSLSSM